MPPHYVVFTTLLKEEDIVGMDDQLVIVPGIYQEYCEKSYEIRITIIGEEIFIAKIDSQAQDITSVDWRKDQLINMYSPGMLSNSTLNKLKKFHKTCNLVYAAYDFIVDKFGNEIFLECNPGGQWLWIENALQSPISEKIAHRLGA